MAFRREGRCVLEWLRERFGIKVLYGHPETTPFVIINKPKNLAVRSEMLNFNNFKTNVIDTVDTSAFGEAGVTHSVESIFRSLNIEKIKTIYFPHRLDYKTEGILVLAFDSTTCSAISKDILRHRWVKKYRAIVHLPNFVKDPDAVYRPPTEERGSLDQFTQDYLTRVNNYALHESVRHETVVPFVSGSVFTPLGFLARNGTLRSFTGKSCAILREPPGELIKRGRPAEVDDSSSMARLKLPLQHAIMPVIPKELKGRMKNTSFYDSISRADVPNYNGKFAETHFELLKANYTKRFAMFELQITTGRTHQIRLHLSSAGLPIVGDTRYGIDTLASPLAEKRFPYLDPKYYNCNRIDAKPSEDSEVTMYLQACSLRLPNPLKYKEFIQVDLPLNESWQRLLDTEATE